MPNPKPIAYGTTINSIMALALEVYFQACEAAGEALDPEDLGICEACFDCAFGDAARIESIAKSRGISWTEAADFL